VSIGQSKVIEQKPKVDACPPARRRLQHYNNPVFVENLVKNTEGKINNTFTLTLFL